MGLDFTDINNKTVSLLSLTDKETDDLLDVFLAFNNQFDNYFDFYKNTRLYKNHIEHLIMICSEEQHKNNTAANTLKNFLLNVDGSVLIIGD